MESKLTVSLLSENEFSVIKEDWNHLLQESSNNEFFLTWEWVYTWWQVYGKGKKLFIIAVKDENDILAGIAPCCIKQNKILGIFDVKKALFLGIGENVCPEYLNIIAKKGFENIVVRNISDYLLANKSEWDVVLLSEILEGHNILSLIIKEAKEKNIPYDSRKIEIPCVYLSLPKTWDDLWVTLSRNFKKNVKWGRAGLTKDAKLQVKILFGEEFACEKLVDLSKLHNKRMQNKGLTGKFEHQDYRIFHSQLLEIISENKVAALFETDNETIAMLYGYSYNNKIYIYQTGFDPDSQYKKYSINTILHSYLIEEAIKRKYLEIDFLRGEEEHKYRWTDTVRYKNALLIFNTNTWQGKLVYALHKIKNVIKRAKAVI